jgi:cardiolipin synthase (CMP-forming)
MGDRQPEPLGTRVFTVPNLLSAFRILLIPIFVWALVERRIHDAFVVFFIAGLTDLFDGLAARAWHQRSRLGAILDPAGDKLLMATSCIILTIPSIARPNAIPLWLTVIIFLRDLMIVAGALYAYLSWRQKIFPPTLLGKISTGCQVGMIFFVLFFNARGTAPGVMSWFFAITLFWTVASGLQYFVAGLGILKSRRTAKA